LCTRFVRVAPFLVENFIRAKGRKTTHRAKTPRGSSR
jgi:hypothetical protein